MSDVIVFKIQWLEDEQAKEVEEKIGYTFKDKSLLSTAFRRKSYTEEHPQGNLIPNNEVLEFYGDSVLNLIVVKATAKDAIGDFKDMNPPSFSEEGLTHFVSNYTDKSMLSSIIESMDIAKYLITSKGDKEKEVWKSPSVMEDLFEAIVGAMWLDNDLNVDAIYDNVLKLLDFKLRNPEFFDKNAYVKLKEYIDRHPEFRTEKRDGIYYLYLNNEIVTYSPAGGLPGMNRYESMIFFAKQCIDMLKQMNAWDVPYQVPTEGVTVDNAINKLQELYQKKVLYLNPVYSDGILDREKNLWIVDVTFPDKDQPVTHTGTGKTKNEAKKNAAYSMYQDVAKHLNKDY